MSFLYNTKRKLVDNCETFSEIALDLFCKAMALKSH